ncbi:hypothetical protein HHK36_025512 [Tetracentron sinense]|uniref:Uncharacterized protein n=1 Tax=Tetracentron sinense TaxID=13715 RepID=A0A835D5M0_TETSI|nr:hypothetical protein HHK36_025512 [Tetracentron sinense]
MSRTTAEPYGKSTGLKLILVAIFGVITGYCIGSSFPRIATMKVELPRLTPNAEDGKYLEKVNSALCTNLFLNSKSRDDTKIYVTTNPRGAESLPPGIIESESDFYLHSLQGNPSEDLVIRPKYLLALTVGYNQKNIINTTISKFSDDFSFVLFHYDGRTSEWDQFEWSKRAIHISARKQTKWWYAKRFLHPDIVAPYEYLFIWDEDLGVEHFNAEEYIKLVRKHGLEISQPGLEANNFLTWMMTKRREDVEVHKVTEERPGWCHDPHLPPCAGYGDTLILEFTGKLVKRTFYNLIRSILKFVEIMAPVFSRESWRCVWHMIQNDLVHGWGLDLALRRCVEPPHEKIGVVDAQWIEHMVLPSLGDQGEANDGRAPWEGVRARCNAEWRELESRMAKAEHEYVHRNVQ